MINSLCYLRAFVWNIPSKWVLQFLNIAVYQQLCVSPSKITMSMVMMPPLCFVFDFQHKLVYYSFKKQPQRGKQSQKVVDSYKDTNMRTGTHTHILSLKRTHNWAIFNLREWKKQPGSSQWNRPQDPELQSLGASTPPEHMTLPKLTEPHQKLPPFTSPPQQPTQCNLLFTHTMSTYIPRLQKRTYACKLCSTDISSGSHPCSIWAHQMEIQHMALCHDAPLCHNLPTFSQIHTHNSHFPHSATTMKLAFTLEWAAADAGGRGRDGVWGGEQITPADPRKDQPKTNRELLTLSWVRPNHLNLLTHSVPPPSPNACWCDLSICSQRSEEV